MGGSVQGKVLSLTQKVATFAGSSSGVDGVGASARFIDPAGITTDGANLYVTCRDNTIRKIAIATGEVNTLAGTPGVYGSADGTGAAASFNWPKGIVTDGPNLYVADSQNEKIRKIVIATGQVSTLAGSGNHGSVDGVGTGAGFSIPTQMTTDGTNLYVHENGYTGAFRKVEIATGTVTTFSTNQVMGGDITTDGKTVFVAEAPSIRKIDIATGSISSQLTNTGTPPYVVNPAGLTMVGGSIYFTDGIKFTVNKLDVSTGLVTTVAGNAGVSGAVDGIASAAGFFKPMGITSDGLNLYVIDERAIRKVTIATGEVTTVAGKITTSYDGIGSEARFGYLGGITTDGTNLYATDVNLIRKIDIATGTVSVLANIPRRYDPNTGILLATLVRNITTDGTNIYGTDTSTHIIWKIIIATGEFSIIAGNPGVSGYIDGIGTAALFKGPLGITTDGKNLYITDSQTANTIRKVVISTGEVTTLAGSSGVTGYADGVGANASFYSPSGITTDGVNLFVCDYANRTIRMVDIATGKVTTLAGTPGVYGSADGTGASASFRGLNDITTDGKYLYVADANTVRKIEISSGIVTTESGNASKVGSVDGNGSEVRYYYLSGVTTDGKALYAADSGSYTIRKIE